MAGFVEIFIFFALLYWLFYPRVYLTATSMVDILAGTFQKVYGKVDNMFKPVMGDLSKDRTSIPGRVTMNSLDRHGNQLRKDQRVNRKKVAEVTTETTIFEDLPLEIRKICDGDGVAFKASKVLSRLNILDQNRPIMGVACKTCIPSIHATLASRASHQFAIENVLLVDTQGRGNSYFTQFFCHLTSVWQRKNHYYPKVYTSVLQDERLRDAITSAAEQKYWEEVGVEVETKDEKIYNKYLAKQETRAIEIINHMRTNISDFLLKAMSWLMYKLVPRFIMSVSTHPAQIEMLKAAGKSGLPLIFLPLHRSHLDYILITFILLCNDIQAPLVAAGDNLKIPFFGWLLRSLGAFFIKRRMDPVQGRRDTVYRAVLHTYMMECLRAGHNIEFFIEGGRTRTGKPCMPKGGLLSVIVDAYMDGTISDALLVPVSLNYEKLVDGNFVREQMGQPKQMETFGNAIKAIYNVLNSNYGMMRIDFHQPFSLMELVKSFQRTKRIGFPPPSLPPMLVDADGKLTVREKTDTFHQTPSSASLYGTDICHEEHRHMVESIARHVIYDCTKATAVMSTNAIAFLLLHKFRDGATMPMLVEALNILRNELIAVERDVGFCGESVDVVNHALELLGPGLVHKEKQLRKIGKGSETEMVTLIKPIIMLPNVIELCYYSNTVVSHYVMEAVVVSAMYSMLGDDIKNTKSVHMLYVKHETLLEKSLLICDILQYEFIFAKPCQDMETLIMDVIQSFKNREILVLDTEEPLDENKQWSLRYAKRLEEETDGFSDDEDYANLKLNAIEYKLVRSVEVNKYLEFLHGVLRPLVDVYTVSALCLSRLVGRQLVEHDYVQEILKEMTLQLDSGFLHYGESMAVDPIKCSLKLFEHWRVLECHTNERLKLYYLSEKFDRESEAKKVFDIIYQFKWVPEKKYAVNTVYENSP